MVLNKYIGERPSLKKMEHYKKKMIHQHEKPEQLSPLSCSPADEEDCSSSSSAGPQVCSDSSQNSGATKGPVHVKIPRKRAVCRSKFRHKNMEIYKLGTSIPTSLCKTKEPYNVCTEKNLQMCSQNHQNGKKEEEPPQSLSPLSKESITESIINSIDGNKNKTGLHKHITLNMLRNGISSNASSPSMPKIDPSSNTNLYESTTKNVSTGRHSLPAIISETPVRRKNKFPPIKNLGKYSDKRSKSIAEESIANKSKAISKRRKTVCGSETSVERQEIRVNDNETPETETEERTKNVSQIDPINLSLRHSDKHTIQNLSVEQEKNHNYEPRNETLQEIYLTKPAEGNLDSAKTADPSGHFKTTSEVKDIAINCNPGHKLTDEDQNANVTSVSNFESLHEVQSNNPVSDSKLSTLHHQSPTVVGISHNPSVNFPTIHLQLQRKHDSRLTRQVESPTATEDNEESVINTIILIVKGSMTPNFSLETMLTLNKWYRELKGKLLKRTVSKNTKSLIVSTLNDTIMYITHNIFGPKVTTALISAVEEIMQIELQSHKELLSNWIAMPSRHSDDDRFVRLLIRVLKGNAKRDNMRSTALRTNIVYSGTQHTLNYHDIPGAQSIANIAEMSRIFAQTNSNPNNINRSIHSTFADNNFSNYELHHHSQNGPVLQSNHNSSRMAHTSLFGDETTRENGVNEQNSTRIFKSNIADSSSRGMTQSNTKKGNIHEGFLVQNKSDLKNTTIPYMAQNNSTTVISNRTNPAAENNDIKENIRRIKSPYQTNGIINLPVPQRQNFAELNKKFGPHFAQPVANINEAFRSINENPYNNSSPISFKINTEIHPSLVQNYGRPKRCEENRESIPFPAHTNSNHNTIGANTVIGASLLQNNSKLDRTEANGGSGLSVIQNSPHLHRVGTSSMVQNHPNFDMNYTSIITNPTVIENNPSFDRIEANSENVLPSAHNGQSRREIDASRVFSPSNAVNNISHDRIEINRKLAQNNPNFIRTTANTEPGLSMLQNNPKFGTYSGIGSSFAQNSPNLSRIKAHRANGHSIGRIETNRLNSVRTDSNSGPPNLNSIDSSPSLNTIRTRSSINSTVVQNSTYTNDVRKTGTNCVQNGFDMTEVNRIRPPIAQHNLNRRSDISYHNSLFPYIPNGSKNEHLRYTKSDPLFSSQLNYFAADHRIHKIQRDESNFQNKINTLQPKPVSKQINASSLSSGPSYLGNSRCVSPKFTRNYDVQQMSKYLKDYSVLLNENKRNPGIKSGNEFDENCERRIDRIAQPEFIRYSDNYSNPEENITTIAVENGNSMQNNDPNDQDMEELLDTNIIVSPSINSDDVLRNNINVKTNTFRNEQNSFLTSTVIVKDKSMEITKGSRDDRLPTKQTCKSNEIGVEKDIEYQWGITKSKNFEDELNAYKKKLRDNYRNQMYTEVMKVFEKNKAASIITIDDDDEDVFIERIREDSEQAANSSVASKRTAAATTEPPPKKVANRFSPNDCNDIVVIDDEESSIKCFPTEGRTGTKNVNQNCSTEGFDIAYHNQHNRKDIESKAIIEEISSEEEEVSKPNLYKSVTSETKHTDTTVCNLLVPPAIQNKVMGGQNIGQNVKVTPVPITYLTEKYSELDLAQSACPKDVLTREKRICSEHREQKSSFKQITEKPTELDVIRSDDPKGAVQREKTSFIKKTRLTETANKLELAGPGCSKNVIPSEQPKLVNQIKQSTEKHIELNTARPCCSRDIVSREQQNSVNQVTYTTGQPTELNLVQPNDVVLDDKTSSIKQISRLPEKLTEFDLTQPGCSNDVGPRKQTGVFNVSWFKQNTNKSSVIVSALNQAHLRSNLPLVTQNIRNTTKLPVTTQYQQPSADPLLQTPKTWKCWISEKKRKQLIAENTRPPKNRRLSTESVSSGGSEYSPKFSDDNRVHIKIDGHWYTVNKAVYQRVPKGKLCYIRKSNTLIRYFDDNQMEQFMENLNDPVATTSGLFRQRGDHVFSNLDLALNPFDFSEKNEFISISKAETFSKEDHFVDPEIFVEEIDKVRRFVPHDFYYYYKFVTGYQIMQSHIPVSFQTFLTMHNTNRLKLLFKNYMDWLIQHSGL